MMNPSSSRRLSADGDDLDSMDLAGPSQPLPQPEVKIARGRSRKNPGASKFRHSRIAH